MRLSLLRTLRILLITLSGVFLARLPATADPLGPSSRRTSWVISEIMYRPAPRTDARQLEFVEIHNAGLIAEDLGGHRLGGDWNYSMPANTVVPAGGFVVIGPVPGDLSAVYGIGGVLGGFDRRLGSTGDLRLYNPAGALLLEVRWSADPPWPAAADGGGHSLVLNRPSFGEADPRAWSASARIGGSPAAAEPPASSGFEGVVLNEILAHTDPPLLDFVELHNHARNPIDVGGCRLTDDAARPGFSIPAGTSIPAGGFLAYDESQLGFALNAAGETVFLFEPDGSRVVDAVRFGPQANGVAFGRSPDGAPTLREMRQPTPGTTNAKPLARDIVISEIMYHPIDEDADEEFVELFNRGTHPVELGGWRFIDGIGFEFPPGARLEAGAYLAVARNLERLRTTHPGLDPERVVGNFSGSLADRGERLALAMPEDIVSTNPAGPPATNRVYIVVAEVTYGDGGQWGQWSDGGGSSLELIDPRADPRLASNWADSDESSKAPWTTVESTGTLDLGAGAIDQLQIVSQGAGSLLVDDIAVLGSGGNQIANGMFDAGTTGWVMQGTLDGSRWELSEGAGAPGCLRVEAVARGDAGANRIRTPLTGSLSPGTTATIRARARWLRGNPELLLRLRGNYLEAASRLTVPGNLGTPGARNSRALLNAGPALAELNQTPVLPANGQAVTISVRVDDPDGVKSVILLHRIDPAKAETQYEMRDDGLGADAMAGDGVFTGTIPGRPGGTLAGFRIVATDAASQPASTTYPSHEALIRWGETGPSGTLGTYRLWMTKATVDEWTMRSKLDNSPLPVTFVYNGERVIHGVGAYYAGSPHISPGYTGPAGTPCGYVVVFPPDDRLLGATDVVLDWPGRDSTAQQEPIAYWIARELGIPFNHRRFVRLHVNGVTETARGSVYEDAQQVNADLVESWNPDAADAELYKIEQWFEFDDSLNTSLIVAPRLENYTTSGGVKKPARYRWSWLKRAVHGSASDFQSLFTLVDAANATSPALYPRQLFAFADLEEWMRIFATENIVVNLDAWGYDIGKNMYACKPASGRWQLHMWDIDWVMLASAQHGYSPTSPLMYRGNAVFGEGNRDPVVGRMYNQPDIQRAYWRAIEDAINGPLVPSNVAARMDATYAALVAQGVTRSSGSPLTGPGPVKTWLASRRAYLVQQLAGVSAPFSVSTPPASIAGTNLLRLTGTAPIAVAGLLVNGKTVPMDWATVSNWTASVILAPGNNALAVMATDRFGQPVPGATAALNVSYSGSLETADTEIILNEIQYHPAVSGAGFVELFNRSTTTAFDLSGWRLDGVDLDLPAGTLLSPASYLLVAADRQALATAHGIAPYAAAEFPGRLLNSGEALTLVRPGATAGQAVIVNRVAYSDAPPWPPEADGTGASLQLIDPSLDNRHPAGWSASPPTPGAPNTSSGPLPTLPPLWLNELQADNRTGPRDRAGDRDPWVEIVNTGDAPVSLGNCFLSDSLTNLTRWPFPAGLILPPAGRLMVWLDGEPAEATAGELHAGFRLSASEGSLALVQVVSARPFVLDAITFADVGADQVVALLPDGDPNGRTVLSSSTPGSPNRPPTSHPSLFINEWLAANHQSATDPADGHFDDWFELYNAGSGVAELAGYFLSDDPANPRKYAVPPGTRIPPNGFLLVWADEDASQNEPGGALHAAFKLSQSGETILLSAPDGAVVDRVDFGPQAVDVTQGRWPDGGLVLAGNLARPTPGAPNLRAIGAQPQIAIARFNLDGSASIVVTWISQPDRTDRLQAASSLAGDAWIDVSPDIPGSGGETSVFDTIQPEAPARFYRIRTSGP